MDTRQLGELQVSALGLGCMSMSQSYGEANRQESERTLHRALDIGYTFLDTASLYGLGHNETLIGEVLAARRNEFILASKCGIVDRDGKRAVDCRPENVKKTCEESLRRLNTDVIDLYYLHRRDFDVPIEESVGALADFVSAGKIRYIGLSECSSMTIRKAHAEHPICAVQSEYSLQNLKQLTDLREIAAANSCTMAQLALAWVLAQDSNFVPIPGTKHVKFVEENAQAAELQISAEDLARVGEVFGGDSVCGDRYAKSHMISLDPD